MEKILHRDPLAEAPPHLLSREFSWFANSNRTPAEPFEIWSVQSQASYKFIVGVGVVL